MEIGYSINGDVLEVCLKGELDESEAAFVRAELDNMINTLSYRKVELNFKELTFMDSTGVGVILGRYKKLKEKNVKLSIKHQSQHIDKVLKTTGIYSILAK